jgi:hypothetical protein
MATNPFFQDQYQYGAIPVQPTQNAAPSLSTTGGNILGAIGSGLINTAGAVGTVFNPFGGVPTTYGKGTYGNSTAQSSVAPYSLASALAPKPIVAPQVVTQQAAAPKVTAPSTPVVAKSPITESVPTSQTVNDLWMRQGETPDQYKTRTGITPPADGSIASIGEIPTDYLNEMNAYGSLAAQGLADSTANFNSASEQQKYTSLYQDRINSINSLYNDMIAQSRANNAPVYAAREQQGRLSAVQGGIVGNPMAEAQQSGIQTANQKEQAAAEALIIAQRNQEINAIYGKIDDQVAKAQERFDQAKAEGGKTYAEAIKNKNSVRKAILEDALSNIKDNKLSDTDIANLSAKLGLSAEYIRNEVAKKNSEYSSAQEKAASEQEKAAADLAYKQAQTAKTTAETAQVGKMSPREAAQTEIEWYKATHPAKSASADKMNAVGTLANAFAPGSGVTIPDSDGVPFVDDRGYATPEGWKTALVASKEADMTRKEFIEEFGYLIKEGEESSYGLTAADIKIIRGALPTNE